MYRNVWKRIPMFHNRVVKLAHHYTKWQLFHTWLLVLLSISCERQMYFQYILMITPSISRFWESDPPYTHFYKRLLYKQVSARQDKEHRVPLHRSLTSRPSIDLESSSFADDNGLHQLEPSQTGSLSPITKWKWRKSYRKIMSWTGDLKR